MPRNGQAHHPSANLDQILMQGDLSQNIPLRDGDVIYVPRSIIGDINDSSKTSPRCST